MLILTTSLIKLILGHLACKFVLFLQPVDMSIFVFTDCKCSLYVYQAKFSLLDKMKHIISLHAIQNVLSLIYLPLSLSLTYYITY
jgi:hypothetical protein